MAITTQDSPVRVRSRAGVLLPLALVLAIFTGGCSSSSSGREAYFEARTATVMFQPGSGETRLSLSNDSPFGNDVALAERNGPMTDITRWSDAGLEP
jgi:hypothetical protein